MRNIFAITLVNVLILSFVLQSIHAQSPLATPDQSQVSVAMKHTKKITLVSFRNDGEVPLYWVAIENPVGNIAFIKARGWDAERLDVRTIVVMTDERPINPGKVLIILLMVHQDVSILGWSVGDTLANTIADGTVIERSE
ncbi:MAG: hypothetical protein ACE5KA_05975 [Nitrososphaerales archaeon]